MSNKNNTSTKQTLAVRVLALILAGLMLIGAAAIIISILGSIGHDEHAGHNHASVQYVETI